MPIKIQKDEDKSILYENEDITHKIFISPLAALLNSKIFRVLAHKLVHTSKDALEVKKHTTTHKALEVMYGFEGNFHVRSGVRSGILTYFLQHLSNPKALRNRLKLVRKKIYEIIARSNKQKITILNLGAGSARSTLSAANDFSNKKFHIVLLDKSNDALQASRELVAMLHINGDVEYVLSRISSIKVRFINLQPDIVEMVGILDYYDKNKSVQVFNDVFDILADGGVFITGNILPNREESLVTNIIGWHLIYKDLEELEEIIRESKFDDHKAIITYEPLKIHAIIELHK